MSAKVIILAFIGLFSASSFYFLKKNSTQHDENTNSSQTATLIHPETSGNPEELGKVAWIRDLDIGIQEAKKSKKPLFILFQEVPGCSNCTRFGNVVLSHPLIVEAIETFFVPVCIYNNQKGKDALALEKFGEAAWNNPVVRIVEADSQLDIVPRIANFHSTYAVVDGMKKALTQKGINPYQWFDLLHEEQNASENGLKTATFTMYCFWSGEAFFGQQTGVMATAPGFQGGHEVVQVQFDPRQTSQKTLQQAAEQQKITPCNANTGFSGDKEPKYYMAQTFYRAVPMTELQATKANSRIGKQEDVLGLLSPRQQTLADFYKNKKKATWPNYIGEKDLIKTWDTAIKATK